MFSTHPMFVIVIKILGANINSAWLNTKHKKIDLLKIRTLFFNHGLSTGGANEQNRARSAHAGTIVQRGLNLALIKRLTSF
jgi:hypothetical protein